MWTTNKRDRCLRSSLLIVNCAACIATVYIYLTYIGGESKTNAKIREDFIQPEKLTDDECIPVCESKECIWHANILLRNLNSSADPCDNFHTFLCGGFVDQFGREDAATTSMESQFLVLNKLKGIMENVRAEPGSASAKMKTVYNSCLNYASSELQGVTELKNFLNSLGLVGWPNITQDFNFSDTDLPTVLGTFSVLLGDFVKLNHLPAEDNKDGTDGLQVSFESYSFDNGYEIPREVAVSILKYFDIDSANREAIIEDHKLVKNSISHLYEENTCEENCTPVYVNCSEMREDKWQYLCKTMDVFLNFTRLNQRMNTQSVMMEKSDENFFKNLFPLLHSLPSRSVANFFVLSFIQKYQGELNFYFRFSKLKFKNHHNTIVEMDRWRYCLQWIVDNMPNPLANEFHHQYLTSGVVNELLQFYDGFKSNLYEWVHLQEWIPPELKSHLENMISSVEFSLQHLEGYLPNDTLVDTVYRKFHPIDESFFYNVLELKRSVISHNSPIWILDLELMAIRVPGFEVNAYEGSVEGISIDYGLLLPPFYKPGHLSLFNRIQQLPVIIHEVGHSIYTIFYAADEIPEKFSEISQCLVNQISAYKYQYLNQNLNGTRFESESLPDYIASALIDEIAANRSTSEDSILPGLPFSSKQLLLMIANQRWCEKRNLKLDTLYNTVATHAPDEFRLINIVQNSREFPDAFQCPSGTFMNPTNKCSLP